MGHGPAAFHPACFALLQVGTRPPSDDERAGDLGNDERDRSVVFRPSDVSPREPEDGLPDAETPAPAAKTTPQLGAV